MDSYGLIHEDWTCYGFIWIQMKLRWNYMDHYGFVCDCASPKMYGPHNCHIWVRPECLRGIRLLDTRFCGDIQKWRC